MREISSRNAIRAMMKKYGIRPKKGLGQNFLVDTEVLSDIVEALEVSRKDIVLEIGAGPGVLTAELCGKARGVVAVEIDQAMVSVLRESVEEFDNVKIIKGDILKTDINSAFDEYCSERNIDCDTEETVFKIAGNLPYYITTPIIMGLLEEKSRATEMVFMVQKEVAERMAAAPGGKDYGILSIMVQYYSVPRIVAIVSPKSFIPEPGVESAIVKLAVRKEPAAGVEDEKLFFNVVKAAFNQRRKTLLNALSNSRVIGADKNRMREALSSLNIPENTRAEELSIHQFSVLSNTIKRLI